MLTHEEMIGLQAEKHDLIDPIDFESREKYVLHLIHSFAYTQAAVLAQDKEVLDLGCNTGYGTEILSRSARKVVGVDVSDGAVAQAKSKYGNQGIEFHCIDGKSLPFEDGIAPRCILYCSRDDHHARAWLYNIIVAAF